MNQSNSKGSKSQNCVLGTPNCKAKTPAKAPEPAKAVAFLVAESSGLCCWVPGCTHSAHAQPAADAKYAANATDAANDAMSLSSFWVPRHQKRLFFRRQGSKWA